MINIIPQCK